MANILFVTCDAGGNVPPAIGIGTELLRRGHSVRFLGHEQQRSRIEGVGLRFKPYSQPVEFSSTSPKGRRWFAIVSAVLQDPSLGVDLRTNLNDEPTDFVVIDCLLATVRETAQRAGVRRAVLVHSFLSIAAVGMASNELTNPRDGSPSPRPWGDAELCLVATLRSLDPDGTKALPPSVRYTGPVWQGTPAPANRSSGQPVILISMSTCWFPGQRQVLQNILDAVCDLPVRAIVTTGPAVCPADLEPPDNAELHQYLPHQAVLPTVSLVVGHGGHATTMAALGHDLPIIVLPMLKNMDQRGIGRAVQQAGAGLLLAKRSTPARIRQAITELLGNDNYHIAAKRLGEEIRHHDGATAAADAIGDMLTQSPG